MDLNEYLPMFLAESREHLQELNLAVVRVEEEPDDHETVGDIFRIAHSLKGMSATMGFERIAALTHAMEDVFELLRQRRGGLERAAVDALLECLDALSEAFEAIEVDGVERLDEKPLVDRLHTLVREPTEAPPPDEPLEPEILPVVVEGNPVLHVTVTLREDALMPSVRAYMTLTALADHGEIVASEPAESAVDHFAGRTIEVWLATGHETAVVQAAAAAVPDVAEATVEEPRAASASTPTDERAADPGKSAVRHRSPATSTVRVDSERLDQLMHLMGELVVHRTHAESLVSQADVPGLSQAMQDVARSSQALQAMVMQIRMIPVEAVFLRFPRLVRDLSSRLEKKVDLQLSGQDTELDRTVVDALGDPLVHLVRNALDHGLESPEERVAAGKEPTGTLEISARHAGGSVLITVSDDGHGVDPARVARKAAERGLIAADAVDSIDTKGALELLFAPGFSTAEEMSDVSGRGVGMDAVRTTIRELGGEVLLQSDVRRGDDGADPAAADPGDRRRARRRVARRPVRDPARPRRADAEARRLPGALGRRQPDARPAGRRPADRRPRRAPSATAARSRRRTRSSCAATTTGSRSPSSISSASASSSPARCPRSSPAAAAPPSGAVLSNGQIALIVDCDAVGATTSKDTLSVPAAA